MTWQRAVITRYFIGAPPPRYNALASPNLTCDGSQYADVCLALRHYRIRVRRPYILVLRCLAPLITRMLEDVVRLRIRVDSNILSPGTLRACRAEICLYGSLCQGATVS